MPGAVSVSAPGKVLLAGGYLVLERPNVGVVLSTTARFFCTAQWATVQEKPEGWASDKVMIVVESPQFRATYRYLCTLHSPNHAAPALLSLHDEQFENHYVKTTLELVLTYLREQLQADKLERTISNAFGAGEALFVKLRADNNFYSQIAQLRGMTTSSSSLKALPNFLPCLEEDGKLVVAKTGMGSSAAMITSLVGCLLAHFEVVNLPTKDCHEMDIASLDVVHKLAQVCHASAQGKVGSGFDVSAAVYGSHTYTRFSPSVIDQVLGCEHSSPNLPRAVQSVVLSSSWDCSRDVLMLPHCFRLLMGDVQGGSSTPSMARSVLAWRNSGGDEPNRVWSELSQVNLEIARLMGDIAGAAGVEDESRRLAQVLPNQWRESACSIEEALLFRLRRLFLTARHLLRTIGTGAGVPIEPNSQTQLADASMELPGVLCAGVPGAGGEDAVFAIVVHPTAVDALEALWCSWKGGSSVCPLTLEHNAGPGLRMEKGLGYDDKF